MKWIFQLISVRSVSTYKYIHLNDNLAMASHSHKQKHAALVSVRLATEIIESDSALDRF